MASLPVIPDQTALAVVETARRLARRLGPETGKTESDLALAVHNRRGARAPTSDRSYRSGLARFVTWCDETCTPYAFPAHAVTPEAIAAFIDDMQGKLAPASVEAYVAAIGAQHRALDIPDPTKFAIVGDAKARMKRAAEGTKPGQKKAGRGQSAAMRRGALDQALGGMGAGLADLRDAALISLAYDTLCRASEVAALRVRDLENGPDGASVRITRSKTDQTGQGAVAFVAPDTLARLQAWIVSASLEPGDPLFFSLSPASSSNATLEPLSPRSVARIFKARLGAGFSSHSARVGAAKDALSQGISSALIADAGRWKSERMVLHYGQQERAQNSGAAQLARMQGRI